MIEAPPRNSVREAQVSSVHRLNQARKVLVEREKKKQKVQHEFKAIKSKEV